MKFTPHLGFGERQEDLSLAVVLMGPLPVAPGSRFVESMVSESFSTDAFVDFAVL